MKCGETVRRDCENCSTEFEVTLEPKAKGKKDAGNMPDSAVDYCPFCGKLLPEDEDDTDEDE